MYPECEETATAALRTDKINIDLCTAHWNKKMIEFNELLLFFSKS